MNRTPLAAALALLALSACSSSSGTYGLSIDFASESLRAEVRSVEVSLVEACPGPATLGQVPPERLQRIVYVSGEAAPKLRSIAPGSYAIHALGRRPGDCAIVAADCVPVSVKTDKEGTVNLVLRAVSGPACAEPLVCSPESGACGEECEGSGCAPNDGGDEAAAPDAPPADATPDAPAESCAWDDYLACSGANTLERGNPCTGGPADTTCPGNECVGGACCTGFDAVPSSASVFRTSNSFSDEFRTKMHFEVCSPAFPSGQLWVNFIEGYVDDQVYFLNVEKRANGQWWWVAGKYGAVEHVVPDADATASGVNPTSMSRVAGWDAGDCISITMERKEASGAADWFDVTTTESNGASTRLGRMLMPRTAAGTPARFGGNGFSGSGVSYITPYATYEDRPEWALDLRMEGDDKAPIGITTMSVSPNADVRWNGADELLEIRSGGRVAQCTPAGEIIP